MARKRNRAKARPAARAQPPAAPPPAPAVDLDALLAAAGGGGDVIEEGSFRLDLARAQEKIKSFQLSEPHMYVLELVRAAVASSASQVDIRQDADDLVLTFPGEPFTREELAHLFDHLFSAEPRLARLRHLALGVNTALALQPKHLLVETGDGGQGLRLRVQGVGAQELADLAPGEAPRGTRIHLRERVSWKVIREALFVRNPEEPLLEAGCRFAPVPVCLNGRDLRAPLLTDAAACCSVEGRSVRGGLALPATPAPASRFWMCLSGVTVCEVVIQAGPLGEAGVVGFLEHPALRRNASHSGVLHDGAYQACLRAARGALPILFRGWLAAGGAAAGLATAPALRRAQLRRFELAARLLLRPGSKPGREPGLDALLENTELPSALAGVRHPLGEAWAARRREGLCRVAGRVFELTPADLPEGWVVLGLDGEGAWSREALAECLGPLVDVDEELATRERVALNRRACEAERGPARLAPGDWLVRLPIAAEQPALSGELGLPAKAVDGLSCTVVFRRQGVPLARETLEPPAIACAELESPAFQPTPAWDGLARDAAYHAALARLEAAVPDLLSALARRFPRPPPPPRVVAQPCWTPQGLVAPGRTLATRLGAGGGVDARLAREHIDRLLERWAPPADAVPEWLARWPLFHALDGSASSLAELRALPGGPLPCVVVQAWEEEHASGLVLNLSELERRLLAAWLGPGRLEDGLPALEASRAERTAEVRLEQRREANLAAARRRAQLARLSPGEVLVALDLPAEVAPGQIGITAEDKRQGSLRCLWAGLPVCELEFPAPVSVRAVAELEGQPDVAVDDLFSAVQGPGVARILAGAKACLPALSEALVAREDAPLELRQRLFRLGVSRAPTLGEVPPGLRRARLWSSVAHGLLTLDELAAGLEAGEGRPVLLFTPLEADRQREPRPIMRVTAKVARTLARLLGAEASDHSAALERELVALAFLDQSPRPARLEVATALRVDLEGEGLAGEVGLPLEPGAEPNAAVTVLLDGRLIGTRSLDLLGMPLCAVVSSAGFRARADYRDLVADAAWEAAEGSLREAAERLVLAAVAELHAGTLGAGAVAAVRLSLRDGLRRRFAGRGAGLEAARLAPWESALAEARVFVGVSGEVWSAIDLSRARARDGFLWVVPAAAGRPARGRLMISESHPRVRETLEALFGADALRDGQEQLLRDERAQQRRLEAPAAASLPPLPWLRRSALTLDTPVRARGSVGLSTAEPATGGGIDALLIVEGRLLCGHRFEHPLAGIAELALEGLRVDEGWEAPADPGQLAALQAALGARLWEVARGLAEEVAARGEPTPEERLHLRATLRAHLAGLTAGMEPAQAEAFGRALLRAPLFRALAGAPLSAGEALAAAAAERLAVLSEAAIGQAPDMGAEDLGPWEHVLRADEDELALLRRLLGPRLVLADTAWRERARFADPGLLEQVQRLLGRAARRALERAEARALTAKIQGLSLAPRGDGALVAHVATGARVDPDHPLWRGVQRACRAGWAPDPLPILAAAVLAALVPEAIKAEEALAVLAALAG